MALNWNIGECEQPEELYVFQDDMEWNGSDYCFTESTSHELRNSHRITQQMTFTLMSIGMGAITEKNKKEVVRRIKLIEKKWPNDRHLLWLNDQWERVSTDMAMVERRVGLSTNVAHKTKAEFAKSMEINWS